MCIIQVVMTGRVTVSRRMIFSQFCFSLLAAIRFSPTETQEYLVSITVR